MTVTATREAPPAVVPLSGLAAIDVGLVDPGDNRRGPIGDVTDLARSIAELGQLEPVTVYAKPDGRFEVFEGHRRHAAVLAVGAPKLLAVIRRRGDDGDPDHGLRQVAIHTQRRDFDPIAQARVLSDAMFERRRTREEIAQAIGRKPEWVRDRISLLTLKPGEQARVAAGELAVTRALEILRARRAATNNGGTMPRTTLPGKAPGPKLAENARGGLLDTVLEACRVMGLLVYHTHDSRHSAAGFPDLVIVGPGGCLFRELKGDGGKVSAAQQKWVDALTAAGEDAGFWWPDDLRSGRITRELTALRRARAA